MKYYTLPTLLTEMYNTALTTDGSGSIYLYNNSLINTPISYTVRNNVHWGTYRTSFTEESAIFTLFFPGCSKENIKVTYLEEEGSFKIDAKNEYGHSFCESFKICKNKYNLSEIECSVKNGVLVVTIPLRKDARPKQVKLT